MGEVIFINEAEQVNIGTVEKPYYIPKPTEEEIDWHTNMFKQINKNNAHIQ